MPEEFPIAREPCGSRGTDMVITAKGLAAVSSTVLEGLQMDQPAD
ncbi:hypothetical protein QF026_006067 [Streptomyces aurantiacus]|nr:hypothetical protein [Streptomyces aurantiacus]MDQ0777601.1 hypothetical protein [Streptomyces aurantiacus]